MVYYFRQREKGHAPDRRGKQISRAGRRRTVAKTLRPWEASDGSLRNFARKTHRRVTALRCSLPPSVYLSGLSQAPHPMHRRRFPFSAPPMSGRERKLLGRQGTPLFVSALRVSGLGKRMAWEERKQRLPNGKQRTSREPGL